MHGAFAVEIAIEHGFASQALPAGVQYWEDAGGTYLLKDVVQKPDSVWKNSPSPVPTLGYSDSVYWFRFDVVNKGEGAYSALLEVAYPVLNRLDIFVVRSDQVVLPYYLSSAEPVNIRPYPNRNFIVPLELDRAERVQVYLRVQTNSSIQLPITLWSPQAFLIQDNAINILYGAYLGLVAIMFAYNLKLFFGTKDPSYLYYVFWVVGMAGFFLSLHGLSLQYLWPGQVTLNQYVLVLLVIGIVVSAMQFSMHFLDIHKAMPNRVRLTRMILLVNGLTAVACFFIPYSIMIRSAIVSAVVATAIIGQMSIQRWMQGYRPARYFAVSYALVLLGGVAMSMSKFGFIERSVWTEHSVMFGSALEIVLLNVALADRFNAERRARASAQAQLFEWQQKQQEMLETKVALRTKELELANWQLQQYVHKMARLQTGSELGASLIHELRQPLAAIQSFAQGAMTMMHNALDLVRLERVLGRIVDTSKKGNAMLDRMRAFLLQDAEASQPFDLHESIREAVVWLRPTCLQEAVTLDLTGVDGLAQSIWAQGDGILTQQILVNLMRNAVDAMAAANTVDKTIWISTFVANGQACCQVTDSGPGLPDELKTKLFDSWFTTKPNGMGVGLKLSRSIALEMKGDLTLEPSASGASFVLRLPLAKQAVSNISAI